MHANMKGTKILTTFYLNLSLTKSQQSVFFLSYEKAKETKTKTKKSETNKMQRYK